MRFWIKNNYRGDIGFLSYQIFVSVSALKILYRSGSSVCVSGLCVCVWVGCGWGGGVGGGGGGRSGSGVVLWVGACEVCVDDCDMRSSGRYM